MSEEYIIKLYDNEDYEYPYIIIDYNALDVFKNDLKIYISTV
jgi:hypothetical protein